MTCSASGHADDGGQEMVGEACMQLLPVQGSRKGPGSGRQKTGSQAFNWSFPLWGAEGRWGPFMCLH